MSNWQDRDDVTEVTSRLWPLYLLLIASLGPLLVLGSNVHRMMISTTVFGILILFTILVGARVLLLVIFRRPTITDPLTAILGIGVLYNNFFTEKYVLSLTLLVAIFFLIRAVCVKPEFRKTVPRLLCIILTLANGTLIFNVLQNDLWTGRAELRRCLHERYPPLPVVEQSEPAVQPDIFFIVLDRYAREDQLKHRYSFDNSMFLESLRRRGFDVSSRSYAAYQRTAHSVASTLNLDYLPANSGLVSNDWVPLYEKLREPRLYPFLRAANYRVISLGSWWEPTRASSTVDENITYLTFPESLRPMVEGSMILRGIANLGFSWFDPRHRQYDRIKYKFRKLAELGSGEKPVFVFAHFLVPHPPFVINKDGTFKTVQQARLSSRRDNYIGQLEYSNFEILKLIDRLMEKNPNTLIVLQSDEGPWPSEYAGDEISCFGMDVTSPDWTAVDPEDLREKMAVLNAIYLPGKFSITISDDFSPVNTFRLILREYFGQKLPDLPTQTQVYLNGSAIWQFLDVQDDLAGAEPR